MKTEPLVSIGSITAAATALIALLVAFGAPLTEEQQIAILGVVAVAAPIAVAIAARPRVTPNGKVVEWADREEVLAGPANERAADGTRIRQLGESVTS